MTPDPFPSEPIPGPDLGACPDCGGWRKAGVIHRCSVPDFPSELVEAAAKALREERNTPGVGDPSPWEHATPASRSAYCREARSALAAVLPLIEQRVSRDAYPQAWRYGAANARIVAALRAKGTHAADVLADQIEMEAP